MKRYLSYILLLLVLLSCEKERWDSLPQWQRDLIGRAVNFNASIADDFQTKTTWDESGAFNEYDLMRIYREYSDGNGGWEKKAYRTYFFDTKYATGTTINLGRDWKVEEGRKGLGRGDDYVNPFTQTKADSLTWESGKAVRFRAWARSNYAGALKNCYRDANGITNYYPDYCLSDWVTMSGPTAQIPLTLRHACCRITIAYRNNGSQFYKAEVATEWQDYKRADNADTSENDEADTEHGKTDAQAQEEWAQVVAAYNRMCMPGGVDADKAELKALKSSFWTDLSNNSTDNNKLRYLEDQSDDIFFPYGGGTAEDVETQVQRPVFANVNTSCYLLTIPYDMSNGETQGDIITLPACTRFRIYKRDVNNGDGNNTPGYEGTYHIFSLADIRNDDPDKTPMFPDGIALLPGHSYKFVVGYKYDKLTITASDNFSWTQQDLEDSQMESSEVDYPELTTAGYTWWKTTIKNAIPTDGSDFNPVFHIKDETEFLEFINLVNGTATNVTSGLFRARRKDVNPDHADNPYDSHYWWYTSVSANKRDTTWVTSAEATALGYLLYESYHPANANQSAYSQEEYVRGPYSFYDMTRDRHYSVYLDSDLDLADWCLPSIGDGDTATEHPFMGYFDGQMHTIKDAYMAEEYLFKYINSAAIRNLRLTSTHKLSLAKEGANTCYIVGVDIRAHSTLNPLIERLTSNLYNNPSYVVGCIHVGDAGGALVGASSNMYMWGCMHAAEGIPSGNGALMGSYLPYSSESNWRFLAPQISFDYNNMNQQMGSKPTWSRFMCNYYDTELSPGTNAITAISDLYSPLEYIRGRESFILKAKEDNLLKGDLGFNSLKSVQQRMAYYGLAPWKAMNYGIYRYNQTAAGQSHPCNAHYENDSVGYIHRYPVLLPSTPTALQYANPLEQKN